MYQNCITVLLLCAIALAFPSMDKDQQSNIDNLPNADQSTNLHNLGRVGNKFYFVERTGTNWTAAKEYCDDMGMTLASIDTVAERDFLQSKYENGVFSGWHWTAGRDSQSLSQFVWDDTGVAPAVAMPLVFGNWAGGVQKNTYLSCAAYLIENATTSGITIMDCSTGNGYSLCESV